MIGFQILLLFRLIFSLRRSSILLLWASLEINILRFLPIISSGSGISLENTIKYFLIQRFASVIFLVSSILIFFLDIWFRLFILTGTIFLKLGAAPFHSWFISLIKTVNLWILFFLSRIQKLIPLFILIQLRIRGTTLFFFIFMSIIVIFVGGIGILSLNKVLALSSVNRLTWLIIGGVKRTYLIIIFLVVYIVLLRSLLIPSFNFFYSRLSQIHSLEIRTKLILVFSFISLGGLPPLLGFLGKVIILKGCLLLITPLFFLFLVFSSLIILFFYLNLRYFCFLVTPVEITPLKFKNKIFFEYTYILGIISFTIFRCFFI